MTHDYNSTILLTYSWMMAGFVLMILDLKFSQSIFLLFAGLGAIASSVALAIHPELSWAQQTLIFIGTTLLSAILMFNPLKLLLHRKKSFKNIEGQTATIIDPPQPWRTHGTARWSGTIIRIKMDESTSHFFDNLYD